MKSWIRAHQTTITRAGPRSTVHPTARVMRQSAGLDEVRRQRRPEGTSPAFQATVVGRSQSQSREDGQCG